MIKNILFWPTVSILLLGACTQPNDSNPEKTITPQTEDMTSTTSNLISLFEIPVTDISRAIPFYEKLLGLAIERMEIEGMKMGIFPYENQPVSGILIETEGQIPSSSGTVLYFNVGNDVQLVLDKVEEIGGEILVPKTAHADESGFFAIILDTEGNKIGLNSPE